MRRITPLEENSALRPTATGQMSREDQLTVYILPSPRKSRHRAPCAAAGGEAGEFARGQDQVGHDQRRDDERPEHIGQELIGIMDVKTVRNARKDEDAAEAVAAHHPSFVHGDLAIED